MGRITCRLSRIVLLLSSLWLSGCAAVTAAAVVPGTLLEVVADQFSEHVSLIVDEGTVQLPQGEAVLRVKNNICQKVQAGGISEDSLSQMSQINYLFVCTGNTCRSPMAEGLLRKKLAEIQPAIQELVEKCEPALLHACREFASSRSAT